MIQCDELNPMMRFQSYFNTAIALIQGYNGTTPLVHYLKQYFAVEKKHGAKDRKYIAHLCYSYYRLGHALKELTVKERLRIALFFAEKMPGYWNGLYKPDWIKNWSDDLVERVAYVEQQYPVFSIQHIYPWKEEMSAGIDLAELCYAQFTQPDLFIRLRPGKEEQVKQKLKIAEIHFTEIEKASLAMANGTKLDTVLNIDEEAVIQDLNSQRIGRFFPADILSSPIKVWDCCAASGGKSILVKDTLGNIDLTVSDARNSILHNLQARFEKAKLTQYNAFQADLSTSTFQPTENAFDLVICDAPCTGSGTWSRTPEQLSFFGTDKITLFTALQKKISQNIISTVKPGGYLMYITCSLFKRENEDIVNLLLAENKSLELVKLELLKGYHQKSDTMFVALLKRKS
ncbi:methyltransferase domain-containing protein [Sediminibacterium sp.]|uniref:methyltransferase domain-containing protein n=1 Tax=Sediminibacterium sp. TaxID=1917865 RepID=UPI0025E93278|nr:methyltransferase domain-containing protein [Sediminibacterium sp.]MBW0176531.1 methyltransferase domain-containing protein [Sediminibacterium sp.]